eukprot:gnl/Trimastix_PCT/2917.p1 GENE.gnl/Trimastix_PCT/2917~~gnl/Trimastix_PCT/2917.p1  ORF type:complete len:502 (+),score=129.63 gnl/Trimastix_PCT/2917:45-1508(+)
MNKDPFFLEDESIDSDEEGFEIDRARIAQFNEADSDSDAPTRAPEKPRLRGDISLTDGIYAGQVADRDTMGLGSIGKKSYDSHSVEPSSDLDDMFDGMEEEDEDEKDDLLGELLAEDDAGMETKEKEEDTTFLLQDIQEESQRELKRGQHVKNQINMWSHLLDTRIGMQQILTSCNALPAPGKAFQTFFPRSTSDDDESSEGLGEEDASPLRAPRVALLTLLKGLTELDRELAPKGVREEEEKEEGEGGEEGKKEETAPTAWNTLLSSLPSEPQDEEEPAPTQPTGPPTLAIAAYVRRVCVSTWARGADAPWLHLIGVRTVHAITRALLAAGVPQAPELATARESVLHDSFLLLVRLVAQQHTRETSRARVPRPVADAHEAVASACQALVGELQTGLGSLAFARYYSEARKQLLDVQAQRKKERALGAADPQNAANRRMRRNLAQRESKQRRIQRMRPTRGERLRVAPERLADKSSTSAGASFDWDK